MLYDDMTSPPPPKITFSQRSGVIEKLWILCQVFSTTSNFSGSYIFPPSLREPTPFHVSIKTLVVDPPTTALQLSSSFWVSRENTLAVLILERRSSAHPNIGADSYSPLLSLSHCVPRLFSFTPRYPGQVFQGPFFLLL